MTTITIERELLEQALNALSAPNHCVFSEPPICVDIRAALAAPATAQAAEIERLKTESEERLQNCAALVAEVERLRKDAERYQWLAEYLVSDDESYDDAIVAATTVKEVDSVIDAAMGASPRAHCFCGVRPQAQPATAPDEQLRRDSERYRWLRSQHWSDGQLSVVVNAKASVRLGANCPSHELLDEAIDSAMKGKL